MLKMMTRNEYVPGAQEIVDDDASCFALNVYRCFIFDTLAQHEAKELTALYCNTDDWLTEVLPKYAGNEPRHWSEAGIVVAFGGAGSSCNFLLKLI
jgi:hypothetical protein